MRLNSLAGRMRVKLGFRKLRLDRSAEWKGLSYFMSLPRPSSLIAVLVCQFVLLSTLCFSQAAQPQQQTPAKPAQQPAQNSQQPAAQNAQQPANQTPPQRPPNPQNPFETVPTTPTEPAPAQPAPTPQRTTPEPV